MPDFDKRLGEIWDSLAVDGRPSWQHLNAPSKQDMTDLARSVYAAALEDVAKWLETESVCMMDIEELDGGPFTLQDRVTRACITQWAAAIRALGAET